MKKLYSNPKYSAYIPFYFFSITLIILCSSLTVNAQVQWTNAGSATEWYGATNWTPNTPWNAWLSNDVAQFNDAGIALTAGIDMSQGSLSIGAIKVSNLRTRTLTIGNSSSTPGTLTLNGDASNVILSQYQGDLIGISHITLQDDETGSGKVMNIALGNATDNIISLTGLSSGIFISSSISGIGKKLTLGGSTGVLTLSGANTYTGLTTCNINQGYLILNRPGGGTLPSTNDVVVSRGTLRISTDQTLHDVKIGSSSFLSVENGATLTITGTLSRSSPSGGVIMSGTGKIVYAPGANLEYTSNFLGGSMIDEFPSVNGPTNLILSGGSLVQLNVGSRTIAGLLNLDGFLFLTANDLTCSNLNSTVGGRVVTNGVGRLIISSIGVSPVTLPIGAVGSSNSVTISNGGGLSYAVRVATGITPGIVNSNTAVNRTWFIQPSSAPSSPVNVNFNYSNTHGNAGFNYNAPVELGQFTSAWNIAQTNITQTQPLPTIIASMAGNVENAFVISNVGAVLASGKIDIAVQKQNNKGHLVWAIENTADLVKLEIERSSNGRNFYGLALVNTSSIYFDDNNLLNGTNYYRLKLTAINGKITYSSIAALINKATGFEIVNLLPTVVNNNAILNITAAQKTKMDMLITDVTGRQVQKIAYNLIAGSNQFTLNLAGLSAGTYQITGYTADEKSKTIRFVKQ